MSALFESIQAYNGLLEELTNFREFHQRITPEHLLKALLDDEEGAAAGLIRAAGR